MDTTRITDIMRKRREQLGLTCRDLAERIGTDAGTICRYESGERRIRYDRIIPLADALDMDSVFARYCCDGFLSRQRLHHYLRLESSWIIFPHSFSLSTP